MRKRWTKRIVILTLLFLVACTVAWSFVSTSLTSKEFPLSEKWVTKLQGNIEQLTIVDNSILVARTISEIYALDVRSGDILWRQSIAWHFSYQPVLAKKGMLFLTDGNGVLALDQLDGKTLWKKTLRYPANADVMDATQDLVAVNDPPYLALYQAADGALLWDKDVCREKIQAYFFDTNIVVPCYGLNVLDAYSGETIGETKSDDRTWRSAFADGVIYSSQDLENIMAYDVKNRKELWKIPLANGRSQAFKVIGDYLFVTRNDQLCVLDRDDGRIVWCADRVKKAKNPIIFGDLLYLFNGLQNGITAYDILDGSQIGRLDFPTYNFIAFENDKQLMVSSDEFLIFANGKKMYAYGN